MPTITLSDACIAELKAALAGTGTWTVPSPRPTPEPPAPPAQPPVTNGPILRSTWDWSTGSHILYTYEYTGPEGIGTGLVSISFTVPALAHGVGSVSIAPYPGDVNGCEREISISMTEGDFSAPFPYGRRDVDPSIQFQIGGVSRWAPVLTPGQRYYINIRSHPLPGARADMVIQCSVPT